MEQGGNGRTVETRIGVYREEPDGPAAENFPKTCPFLQPHLLDHSWLLLPTQFKHIVVKKQTSKKALKSQIFSKNFYFRHFFFVWA